jgi:hypothetical protein
MILQVIYLFISVLFYAMGVMHTLSGCKVLWVVEIKAVETSSARLPPPASFEHRGTVETRSVIVSVTRKQ